MDCKKLKLVLCWHMHQPHYKDGLNGEYRLPWVYLHAIKDYTDMAAYLEACPEARAVFNFTPILLDQLNEYAQQMRSWLQSGKLMGDGFLNLVAGSISIPEKVEEKAKIVLDCQRAYAPTMIDTLPAFRQLIDAVGIHSEKDKYSTISYLNDQFFIDLLVWYHIAWMGASLKRSDTRIKQLMDKRRHFSPSDQRLLIEIMTDAIESIIPRYRQLQDKGQIEISMTPYGHPIVPLLLDFNSMRDAMPNAPMPGYSAYPDGYNRSKWHMQKGIDVFQHYFGRKPKGVWLSEGALSGASIDLLDEFNTQWTASGEGVWRHSYEASNMTAEDLASKKSLYQASKLEHNECNLFFRDDGLSDLIGFQYKDWKAEDAVNNFVHNLENIASNLGDDVDKHIVPVILDGENAWEYYPDNGYAFLTELYKKLSSSSKIEMTTFSDASEAGVHRHDLSILKSGSWVYGSFSTWIGDKDKNAAWDLLVEAKQAYDKTISSGKISAEQANLAVEQLAICEGSDWFWWFGDYNPSDSVRDFDNLYRRHLKKLYDLLGLSCPKTLNAPLSGGGTTAENAGTMRRNV